MKSATYIGRRAGKGYVDFVLGNHRNLSPGKEKISKSDLLIKDGKFVILAPANEDATITNMRADLMQLYELLHEFYVIDGESPAYFDAFHTDVFSMEGRSFVIGSKAFKVFQRSLSHHLAFKAPLVRAGLFIDVWGVVQYFRTREQNGQRGPFLKLKGKSEGNAFSENFQQGWFFDKVFYYNNPPPSPKYDDCTYILLVELIHHIEMHLHDHTRSADGKQLLNDPVLVDLMTAKTFGHRASMLVYQMMLDLDDPEFIDSWEHYEMLECGGDLQTNVSEGVKTEVVPSGAMESSASGSAEAKDMESSASGSAEAKGMESSASVSGGAKGMESAASGSGETKGSAKETDDGVDEEVHQ